MSSRHITPEVSALLARIDETKQAYLTDTPGARENLIQTCDALVAELTNPSEAYMRLTWAQPTHLAAVRLGVDIRLYEALARDNGTPKHSEQIAQYCEPQAETLLVRRILRHLAAMGTVRETDVDVYAPTPFTMRMTESNYQDALIFIQDDFNRTHIDAPGFWKQHGYKSPTAANDCPFQYSFDKKKLGMFGYFNENPEIGRRFGCMMTVWGESRSRWFEEGYYPIRERLIDGAKSGEAFVVDIGGGHGHDLQALTAKFRSGLPGPCILQDQPGVIATVAPSPGIEVTAHDFNAPQPVKGARAYYIHNVLEDWSDEECTHILRQIVPAMEKGYSKVLLNEWVVPDKGAHWSLTALDWDLMTVMSARHHTESEFYKFAKDAGLKVTGIWPNPSGVGDVVVECELA